MTIPNSVTSIGYNAFKGCSNLQKLDISASVKIIYKDAFNGCYLLKEIIARPETPPSVFGDNTFSNYNSTLKVPEAGKDAYVSHEFWRQFRTIQTIDVTGISQVHAQAVLIQSESGLLTIQGLSDGTEVSVYGVNGTEAGAAVSRNGQAQVNTNLSSGSVAIVKIGEKSVKVVIK